MNQTKLVLTASLNAKPPLSSTPSNTPIVAEHPSGTPTRSLAITS